MMIFTWLCRWQRLIWARCLFYHKKGLQIKSYEPYCMYSKNIYRPCHCLRWYFVWVTEKILKSFQDKKGTLENSVLSNFCQHFHLRAWETADQESMHLQIQCNLDLVTPYLVTTCDLVTILQRPFFNLLHKIIWFWYYVI